MKVKHADLCTLGSQRTDEARKNSHREYSFSHVFEQNFSVANRLEKKNIYIKKLSSKNAFLEGKNQIVFMFVYNSALHIVGSQISHYFAFFLCKPEIHLSFYIPY